MKILQGKTALITGSTSGIGLSIAHAMAEAGANIVLNGFGDLEEIKKIQNDIHDKHKTKVIYSPADVSSGQQVQKMVEDAITAFKQIDIIVNNAGIQFVSPIVDFPEEKWNSILAINLSSAFKLIKTTLPGMLTQNWGRIINIASAHGLIASPYKSAYIAAKHGLVGLTKAVALEIAETNVTCNAICPGYVRTPLVEKQIAEQAKVHNISEDRVVKEILLKSQPSKKFIVSDHVAQLAVFLCSPAGSSMTGEIVSMDGGWTAQ